MMNVVRCLHDGGPFSLSTRHGRLLVGERTLDKIIIQLPFDNYRVISLVKSTLLDIYFT